jgi:hypothetical protein
MKIIQFILLFLVFTAGVINIYVMDRTCNDFSDFKISGDNLTITHTSEINGSRHQTNLTNITEQDFTINSYGRLKENIGG